MIYCTNCGKQNTQRLEDNNGEPYELIDNLNDWGDHYKGEHNIVTYTTFVCNDCGNLFAIGELDPRAKFPKNEGVSITISIDKDMVKEAIEEIIESKMKEYEDDSSN